MIVGENESLIIYSNEKMTAETSTTIRCFSCQVALTNPQRIFTCHKMFTAEGCKSQKELCDTIDFDKLQGLKKYYGIYRFHLIPSHIKYKIISEWKKKNFQLLIPSHIKYKKKKNFQLDDKPVEKPMLELLELIEFIFCQTCYDQKLLVWKNNHKYCYQCVKPSKRFKFKEIYWQRMNRFYP